MDKIPENVLPECCKDEAKMNTLFAPLRDRNVNPKDWDVKISFWKNLVTLYCTHNCTYCFNLSELNKTFTRKGKPPFCMSVVVNEMNKCGQLQPLEKFNEKTQLSWSSWMADALIKKPLSWSFNTIKNTITTPKESTYVHVEVVKAESEKMLSALPENIKNRIVRVEELLSIVRNEFKLLDIENLKLLLHYLVNLEKADLRTIETEQSGCFLVKINNVKVKPISEMDVSVYHLEQNEKILEKNIEKLEDDSCNCVKAAKTHLKKGHRQMAKTFLRKKHELDKRIDKRVSALHNIQLMLEKLRDSETDSYILDSYKKALAAFDSKLNESGFNEDKVADTMIQLGEMLEIHEDIQHALSKPITEDDSDLEAELADLMKEDKPHGNNNSGTEELEKTFDKLDINNLPDVPDTSPNSTLNQPTFG